MILGFAWYHIILAFVFAMFCLLIMMVILLQRGRGVGLAGAFGGGGAAGGAFGAKTGDMLTWVTVVGAMMFLLLGIILNYVFVPSKISATTSATVEQAAPVRSPAPSRPGTIMKIDSNTGQPIEVIPEGQTPAGAATPPAGGTTTPPAGGAETPPPAVPATPPAAASGSSEPPAEKPAEPAAPSNP